MGYDIPADHHTGGPTPETGVDRKFFGKPEAPRASLTEQEQKTAAYIDAALPYTDALGALASLIHAANHRWWHDLVTGKRLDRNRAELLCLIHSEISEALEGERKNIADTHLPHRQMAEVELADALIRIFDYAGGFGYDLAGAVREKLLYNLKRADHKKEARLAEGGKKF